MDRAILIEMKKRGPEELLDIIMKQNIQMENFIRELKNCRDELCLKCGNYKDAHLGACDDCRYRNGGEWKEEVRICRRN
jgi:hypothetical protein